MDRNEFMRILDGVIFYTIWCTFLHRLVYFRKKEEGKNIPKQRECLKCFIGYKPLEELKTGEDKGTDGVI